MSDYTNNFNSFLFRIWRVSGHFLRHRRSLRPLDRYVHYTWTHKKSFAEFHLDKYKNMTIHMSLVDSNNFYLRIFAHLVVIWIFCDPFWAVLAHLIAKLPITWQYPHQLIAVIVGLLSTLNIHVGLRKSSIA